MRGKSQINLCNSVDEVEHNKKKPCTHQIGIPKINKPNGKVHLKFGTIS